MLREIVNVLCNNIHFCIVYKKKYIYYIRTGNIIDNKLSFIDAVDNQQILIDLNEVEIITFGTNTIPTALDIREINILYNSSEAAFFKLNNKDHTTNNEIFNNAVSMCITYIDVFDKVYSNNIKRMVLNRDYEILKFFKILNCKHIFDINNMTAGESEIVRGLFFELVQNKLNIAIGEINISIQEFKDNEFTNEALIISQDLEDDVKSFIERMRETTVSQLLTCWPTLLNPSPFAEVHIHV